MNKKVTLKDVKESLQPTIQLIKTHTLSSEDGFNNIKVFFLRISFN